ncbi:hypothetical protein [Aureivirga sp. CE67]|uniref:hypothetical protein n=1 Tax=Aureivirga sp. CE67 TaxID=1788983 RepID=UPI0018CAB28F|nr:hypothetical protein [Aureivirga sp. CE67]
MKKIQLPYTFETAITFLMFFGIFSFISFTSIDSLDINIARSSKILFNYLWLPTIISAIQFIPIFSFKKLKKVSPENALIKIGIINFYVWVLVGGFLATIFILLIYTFRFDENYLASILIITFLLFISLFLLNSNRILFKGDYLTEKDKKELEERKTTDGLFQYSEDGFLFKSKKKEIKVKWNEIFEIIAFKVDSYAFDTIGLVIKLKNEDEFSITENTSGWFVFKDKINENLKIDFNWEFQIMIPVMEETAILIYENKG